MAYSRFWCFTVNNPIESDAVLLQEAWERDAIEYLVTGHEVGEEGTPHLQGYVIMKKRLRLTSMKKLLPRAHLECANGTPEQASAYCKKEDSFQEWGTIPVPKNVKGGDALKRKYDVAWTLARNGMWYKPY